MSRVLGVPVTNDELLADLRADWQSPVDVKSAHRNASIIPNNRVVFNIKGNSYRLIVAVGYHIGIIFIRFKLLRHLNCMSKKIKVLWGGRPARPEYTI